ncbi:MAG: beta-propeller domain-containing protein [Acidimicrobiia bacterium]
MPPDLALVEIDVSDPTQPHEISRMNMSGNVVAARMVEASMRLVVAGQPPGLPFVTPAFVLSRWPVAQQQDPHAWERSERMALSQNRAIITESQISDWLPQIRISGAAGASTVSAGCESLARPHEFSGLSITSVLTFDTAGAAPTTPVDVFGLVSDAATVYASAENIYVATQQWQDWAALPEAEWDRAAGFTTTEIHRFDTSDPSAVSYRGSGEVAGWLYSQWALSESDGFLRVASTTQSPWYGQRPETTQSIVSVLSIDEGALSHVGGVTGLGVTEQIYAVRFIGDKGYVVTYRQVDPLYVIDLADPTDPGVAGELKIPGYSAYLHPIGEDLLLGVGQDGDLQGRTIGSQIALFDVSDPTSPTQLDKLTMRGAYSGAEWDHHAFLYWPESDDAGLVVLPIQAPTWQGSLAVDVDSGGVRRVGELEQSGYVLRNLVVGERLFTVTDLGIQSYDFDSLEPEQWLPFA